MHLNTLDYDRWDEVTKDEEWQDVYNDGWKGLRKLRSTKGQNRDFEFDIVMAIIWIESQYVFYVLIDYLASDRLIVKNHEYI